MPEYQWQKSSLSGMQGDNCVEVAAHGDTVTLRESNEPGAVAATRRTAFAAFLAGVRAGRFG
ncbi:DUF397 domain-containing protein [Streptomyces sp. NPDC053048]|uniref:DUF397 domain-containing protein n=1 Tax=Streptomyces sp. NPDC053048 TaxID=3365694 RepID=UPI0037D334B2